MTPFDQAWSLLKMPLVPGSFTRHGDFMRGSFYDPVSSQEMPISVGSDADNADVYGNPKPHVLIFPPEESKDRAVRGQLGTEERSYDSEFDTPPYKREYWPYESYVEPEFRRRGYAKAMYDAMAYYLANLNNPRAGLVPHDIVSSPAAKLWMKYGDPEGIEGFPVREDLE